MSLSCGASTRAASAPRYAEAFIADGMQLLELEPLVVPQVFAQCPSALRGEIVTRTNVPSLMQGLGGINVRGPCQTLLALYWSQ